MLYEKTLSKFSKMVIIFDEIDSFLFPFLFDLTLSFLSRFWWSKYSIKKGSTNYVLKLWKHAMQ